MNRVSTLHVVGRSIFAIPFLWKVSSNMFLMGVVILIAGPPVLGDITVDPESLGYTDVTPASLALWTSSTDAKVGDVAVGEVRVDGGSEVLSSTGYLGYQGTGYFTVDGAGSAWTNSSDLTIGYLGHGTLNITGGGRVNNTNWGTVGWFAGSSGEVAVAGKGSMWTGSSSILVGYEGGDGILNITGGGVVTSSAGHIGLFAASTGMITVDGADSTWTSSNELHIGSPASDGSWGTLNITNGGTVSNSTGLIGGDASTSEVTVDGGGSTWINSSDLNIGSKMSQASGTLYITGGGLVKVAGTLTVDVYARENGFINMSTGGMLALYGDVGESLTSFLEPIQGPGAIHYWDDSISDWTDIVDATYGQDYTLSYFAEGDLAGYTLLIVPEPTTLAFLAIGALPLLRRKYCITRKNIGDVV